MATVKVRGEAHAQSTKGNIALVQCKAAARTATGELGCWDPILNHFLHCSGNDSAEVAVISAIDLRLNFIISSHSTLGLWHSKRRYRPDDIRLTTCNDFAENKYQ